MRPPLLAIVAVGRSRTFPIPFPMVLLWPLVLLFWMLMQALRPFLPARSAPGGWVRAGIVLLDCFWQLGGFRIDVDAHEGTRVHIVLI